MERGHILLEGEITWGYGYGSPSYGMIRPQWRPGCRRYKEPGVNSSGGGWVIAKVGRMYRWAVEDRNRRCEETGLNPSGRYPVPGAIAPLLFTGQEKMEKAKK